MGTHCTGFPSGARADETSGWLGFVRFACGVVADAREVGGEAAVVLHDLAVGEEEGEELVAGHIRGRAGAEAGVGTEAAGDLGLELAAGEGRGGEVNEAEDFVAVDVFGGIHGMSIEDQQGLGET